MKSKDDLFSELKKLSKRANQRIVRLEREFGEDSWATKELSRKLSSQVVEGWSESGRVRAAMSMSIEQMLATIRATEQFLKSKTSRVKGARQVLQMRKENIATALDIPKDKIDDKDVELFIDIANERKASILDKIDPSTFFAIVERCKEINATFDTFKNMLEQYIAIGNDKDLVAEAKYLYNKYVKGD